MVFAATAQAMPRTRKARDHIIDVLIEERAPKLAASALWPAIRPALYAFLDYGKARRMADAIAPMGGRAALDYCSDLLSLNAEARFLERIPREGRLIVIANHPTGIADGVAVYDALKAVRPDIVFYANADAHRVCPAFGEVLIPVEWVEAKRTRERTRLTLNLTREAMEAGRALVIFPAGRVARRSRSGALGDPEWAPTAFSIARKYEAPIAPIHMAGPSSDLFHFFNRFSDELRDITLFHELLNKRGRRFHLTAGPVVEPHALPHEAAEACARMKTYIEHELPADPMRSLA
ncbi:MAG: GNAT family N-acetyltransferase [Caulobacterales bacterium]